MVNEKKQIEMYGCTVSDLDNICSRMGRLYGHKFNKADLVLCILSDAQECMDMGNIEKANKFINRAKYIVMTHLDLTDNKEKRL